MRALVMTFVVLRRVRNCLRIIIIIIIIIIINLKYFLSAMRSFVSTAAAQLRCYVVGVLSTTISSLYQM